MWLQKLQSLLPPISWYIGTTLGNIFLCQVGWLAEHQLSLSCSEDIGPCWDWDLMVQSNSSLYMSPVAAVWWCMVSTTSALTVNTDTTLIKHNSHNHGLLSRPAVVSAGRRKSDARIQHMENTINKYFLSNLKRIVLVVASIPPTHLSCLSGCRYHPPPRST